MLPAAVPKEDIIVWADESADKQLQLQDGTVLEVSFRGVGSASTASTEASGIGLPEAVPSRRQKGMDPSTGNVPGGNVNMVAYSCMELHQGIAPIVRVQRIN